MDASFTPSTIDEVSLLEFLPISDGTIVLPTTAPFKRDLSFSMTTFSTWEKSGSKRKRRSSGDEEEENVETHWWN